MSRKPTFLFCLGATKAGTSWLYQHLAAHPECHFRTIKELHYFTMSEPMQFDRAIRQVEANMAQSQDRMKDAPQERHVSLSRQLADMQDWRAVLARRQIDLPAYRDFLTKDAGDARLVGELTPAYALLSVARLRALRDVAADTRFVYLIRDPLARLWSHVRMIAARTAAPAAFAAESVALLDRILTGDLSGEGQGIVERGDYARIIPRLKRAFAPEHLLIQFQDELLTVPGIARLSGFLGLTPTTAALEHRVHEGKPLVLSEERRARALVWLRPQYDFVASLFPALPEAWCRNMEKGFA